MLQLKTDTKCLLSVPCPANIHTSLTKASGKINIILTLYEVICLLDYVFLAETKCIQKEPEPFLKVDLQPSSILSSENMQSRGFLKPTKPPGQDSECGPERHRLSNQLSVMCPSLLGIQEVDVMITIQDP